MISTLQRDRGATLINIRVSTDSKEFKIIGLTFDQYLKIKCASPPEKGKANREIESRLTEFFGAKTEIVDGNTSKKKKLRIDLPIEQVREKLNEVISKEETWQKSHYPQKSTSSTPGWKQTG